MRKSTLIGSVCLAAILATYSFIERPWSPHPEDSVPNSSTPTAKGSSGTPGASPQKTKHDRAAGEDTAPINIANFKSEDFDRAWDAAKASGSIELDRLFNLNLVVGKMAQSGAPDLILDKIRKEFGPGNSRNQLIGALFMNAPYSTDLADTYQSLEFDDEKRAAQAGLSQVLAMMDTPGDFNTADYAFLGTDLDKVVASGLDSYVSRFYSKPQEELSAAFRKTFEVKMSPEVQASLIAKLAPKAPFDCWEQFTKQGLNLPENSRDEIISRMLYRDSEKAVAMVMNSKNSETYLATTLYRWLEKDARKPIEWLNNEAGNLTAAQQSKAIQGIVDFSVNHGDLEVAREWAMQMSDETLRKDALAAVQSKEESLKKK